MSIDKSCKEIAGNCFLMTPHLFFPINLASAPSNGVSCKHPIQEQDKADVELPLLAVCDRADFPLLAGPAFNPETGAYIPGSKIAPANEWFCKPYGSLYRRFYDDALTNRRMAEKAAEIEANAAKTELAGGTPILTTVRRVTCYRKEFAFDVLHGPAFRLPTYCDPVDLRCATKTTDGKPVEGPIAVGSTLTALEGYAEALQRRIADAAALQEARKRGGRQAMLTDAKLKEFLDDCQTLGIGSYSLRQLRFELQDTYGAGTLALGDIGRLLTGQYRRLPGYDYSKLVELRREENLRAYRRQAHKSLKEAQP
jgi:hypothetical protein